MDMDVDEFNRQFRGGGEYKRQETTRREGLTVVLPLPPKELHPNARPHWGAKARATKKARTASCEAAFSSRPLKPYTRVQVRAKFFMPRRRDEDGLNSWLKAYIDGLQDAGVVVNDSGVTLLPPIQFTGKSAGPPHVVLMIEPLTGAQS